MKDLLQLILTNVTTHPDDVVIEESMDGDTTVYTVTVNPEDMGRVIGRNGKVIRAIRTLVHVAAIRSDARARVALNDSEGGAQAPEEGADAGMDDAEVEMSEPQEEQPTTTEASQETPEGELELGVEDITGAPKEDQDTSEKAEQ